MPKLTIRIGKDGQIKVTMQGVRGPKCVEMTKALREALGETVELERTSEYHEGEEGEPEQEKIKE